MSPTALLWYIALMEAHEENLASEKHVVGKGKSIYINKPFQILMDLYSSWYYAKTWQLVTF